MTATPPPTSDASAASGSDSGSRHAAASGSAGVLAGLVAVLVAYAAAALVGWPQHGRDLIVAAQAAHGHAPAADGDHGADHGTAAAAGHAAAPPLWTVVPFVALLAAIAIFPLTP
ncbi:MAG: hypothetical protein FJ275_00715, partial [Planctomycetes bacterium]|nr:hypothetical protein [Planctomycetota bacterium]